MTPITPGGDNPPVPFRLDEATIEELHAAIRSGQTTCVEVVRHYIDRVRAYNGVASWLVTEDGAPVPETTGAVRAGTPLRFPTETVKASAVLPDLDAPGHTSSVGDGGDGLRSRSPAAGRMMSASRAPGR